MKRRNINLLLLFLLLLLLLLLLLNGPNVINRRLQVALQVLSLENKQNYSYNCVNNKMLESDWFFSPYLLPNLADAAPGTVRFDLSD